MYQIMTDIRNQVHKVYNKKQRLTDGMEETYIIYHALLSSF